MNEQQVKPAKRGKKARVEIIDPTMEQSLYGGVFKKESGDWFKFQGVEQRVHANEYGRFVDEYAECCETNDWKKRRNLLTTTCGNYISRELTTGDDPKWALCPRMGGYYKKINGIEVTEIDNESREYVRTVSSEAYAREYGRCDYSRKIYHGDYLFKVFDSMYYACVMSRYIDGVHFSKCENCGHVVETKFVAIVNGLKTCRRCVKIVRNANLILRHNHHLYPPAILDQYQVMGHKLVNGLICSTMRREEVSSNLLYGVEVEAEIALAAAKARDVNRFDIAREILERLKDFAIIKEDGTLLMNGHYANGAKDPAMNKPTGPDYAGFEIVSAPAGLNIHRKKWMELEKCQHHDLLRAWDTETCGFHVHVSRDALESDLVIGRMLVFLNAKANRKFIWKVAGRSEVAFTRYIDRKLTDAVHAERVINPEADNCRDRSRRVALNLSNDKTVEVRIFRGTINPRHIIRNIEFVDALISFCQPCSRSLNEIYDFRNFVKFVDGNRKRWPLLAAWFGVNEIINLKKILRPEKVNRDLLTLRTHDVPEAEILVK